MAEKKEEQKTSAIARRFRKLRKASGLSQEQVAEKVGCKRQYVQKWEKSEWNPSVALAEKAASAIGATPEDLVGWRLNTESYPIIGRIAAGEPLEMIEDKADEWLSIADVPRIAHDGSFFLRVSGDSMDRVFPEGMLVLVDKAIEPHSRGIFVVNVGDNDATVKRVVLEDDGRITLQPESTNPKHVARTYSPNELHFVGKVVWATYQPGGKF